MPKEVRDGNHAILDCDPCMAFRNLLGIREYKGNHLLGAVSRVGVVAHDRSVSSLVCLKLVWVQIAEDKQSGRLAGEF